MMRALLSWLDERTGYRKFLHAALFENIPGGARWRYVWGSTLVFTFGVQVITGLVLWAAYSPSAQTAWESVYYIEYEMSGGSLLRGIHHYTAQAMVILLVLHLMQVVIDGAYRAPREVNYWFGMALLLLVLGLSLTGYLLPWDQKGFWATRVATNMAGTVPLVGPLQKQLLVGGPEYGHHTLTRFFALHAGLLPGLVIGAIVLHVYLFRRHGIKAKEPLRGPDAAFWPDQALRDGVACLAVASAVLVLAAWRGADLGPPADPADEYGAARPEWYFLFLFQLLKLFEGRWELIGIVVIPGGVLTMLALFPLIARWKYGHPFNCAVLLALTAGAAVLTAAAVRADGLDEDYQAALRENEAVKARVRAIVSEQGILPTGALSMLRQDGATLFAKHCAKCHRYGGHDGRGAQPAEEPKAADLKGFASREWLTGLLDPKRIGTPQYFGATKFCKPPEGQKKSRMVEFVQDKIAKFNPEEQEQLKKVILAISAEAQLPLQKEADARDAKLIEEGRKFVGDDGLACTDCHEFRNGESGRGPDLTGYGSRAWLVTFIKNPEHKEKPKFYSKERNEMPIFEKEGLDEASIGAIADWLRAGK
jgi:ubiquinol-cytochrome c reductase cytochrome b subunit